MFTSKTSKRTLKKENLKQEAAIIRDTLSQLREDVRLIGMKCHHPDENIQQLSNAALKDLRFLQESLEKSLKGKERILRKRSSTENLSKQVLGMVTPKCVESGMSAAEAHRIEKKIMTAYNFQFEEEEKRYMEKLWESVRRTDQERNDEYFRKAKQQSPRPATHSQAVVSSSNGPAIIPSQHDRTSTTKEQEREYDNENQKVKSISALRSGHRSNVDVSRFHKHYVSPGCNFPQPHAGTGIHDTSTGTGKQSSSNYDEFFTMTPARDVARRWVEENAPGLSQRNSDTSISRSPAAPSSPWGYYQSFVDSLELENHWEEETGNRYDAENDSPSDYGEPPVLEEDMERMSIASRNTFGIPKPGRHSSRLEGSAPGSGGSSNNY